MANNQQLLLGEGAGGGIPNYIEEVFSTYLYTGNGSTQTITNGIDLSTKGGLVWSKDRSGTNRHRLYDTVRGGNKSLTSEDADPQDTWSAPYIMTFNSNGYETGLLNNESSFNYASWTFREQPKFFDVVTYTGTGSNTTIAHTLGAVPGCIIVKRTDTTAAWAVYHRSLANTQYLVLDTTAAAATGATWWNSTTPTSSVFSIGTDASVNASGGTYVAYIFAHDAGGFGLAGSDNVISCGSYTGNGSATGPVITLGYEPQWLMIKRTSGSGNPWNIVDNMRGVTANATSNAKNLQANASFAESTQTALNFTATGFSPTSTDSDWNGISETYIYIAIRRGPMKVPTVGTSVYNNLANRVGTSATATISGVGFPVDLMIPFNETSGSSKPFVDRLRGETKYLLPPYTNAEQTNTDVVTSFASNDGVIVGADATLQVINAYYDASRRYAASFFRRAPSFFDVVCYTGTGVNPTNFNHNLGAVPELMIVKKRSGADRWECYSAALGSTKRIDLNTDGAATTVSIWGGTPTATQFSLTDNSNVNQSGQTNVAYLFATCAGVSKVGSYTGTGALQTVACGFTSGARFILIKRTDSTGDWYMYDSARGISSGNDPYLLLNTTGTSELGTNYVDTDTTGFKVTAAAPAAINANGGTFIFLAIA